MGRKTKYPVYDGNPWSEQKWRIEESKLKDKFPKCDWCHNQFDTLHVAYYMKEKKIIRTMEDFEKYGSLIRAHHRGVLKVLCSKCYQRFKKNKKLCRTCLKCYHPYYFKECYRCFRRKSTFTFTKEENVLN